MQIGFARIYGKNDYGFGIELPVCDARRKAKARPLRLRVFWLTLRSQSFLL
jgi:hypothetical protein